MVNVPSGSAQLFTSKGSMQTFTVTLWTVLAKTWLDTVKLNYISHKLSKV